MGNGSAARPVDEVVFRELQAGEAVVLRADTGAYHGLSPSGVAIWKLLDGRRDAKAIADELTQAYDEVPDDLEDRVRVFVEELRVRDLVVEQR